MRKSNQTPLRAVLRLHLDGLTIAQLANETGLDVDGIARSLKAMPDVYIDRWETSQRGRYISAVWCAVVPPENCPKPERTK